MRDNRYLDEGKPTWRPGLSDLARLDTGSLPAEALLDLPGAEGEEMLFLGSPTGRLMPAAFAERVSDLKANGMRDPVNNQPSLKAMPRPLAVLVQSLTWLRIPRDEVGRRGRGELLRQLRRYTSGKREWTLH